MINTNLMILLRIVCYALFTFLMYHYEYLNKNNYLILMAIFFLLFSIIEMMLFDFKQKITFKQILKKPFRGNRLSNTFKILALISFIGFYIFK